MAARVRPGARRRIDMIVMAVGAIALVALVLFALYARGGGPVPTWLDWLGPDDGGLLAPSGPDEIVLRTVRLAGIEHAVIDENGGIVVLRMSVPRVTSPADIELAWQTGFGALSSAYPDGVRYVVQLYDGKTPLLEVAADGVRVRGAVKADDADQLRDASVFLFLSDTGGGL